MDSFSLLTMEGTIQNFRSSRHRQYDRQMIIVAGLDKEKALALVGKTVSWESPAKKIIKGRVSAAHGNSGAIRVIFETGMPGQALTTKVKIE